MGPADRAILAEMPNKLDQAIDFGWFHLIAVPLLSVLNWFYKFVHNYGVAVILLTMLIKLIFWPLSHKSYKSMDQMKRIQPMIQKLREKYADDKERMNQEIMALYKTYKVNPAGGCLPMIVQIPVFFGLYKALLGSIELRHAAFITHLPFTNLVWLADLSAKDPFYITPLIMGATMFLQQKMTPTGGDPTQAKIMLLMPVVFTFLFLNFPAGLVVYWLVNNVLSITQQWWMMRRSSSKA
jgi:YidC/Oxa1 family membrane protein insertase